MVKSLVNSQIKLVISTVFYFDWGSSRCTWLWRTLHLYAIVENATSSLTFSPISKMGKKISRWVFTGLQTVFFIPTCFIHVIVTHFCMRFFCRLLGRILPVFSSVDPTPKKIGWIIMHDFNLTIKCWFLLIRII